MVIKEGVDDFRESHASNNCMIIQTKDGTNIFLCLSFQKAEKKGKEGKVGFGGPVVSSLYQEETIR